MVTFSTDILDELKAPFYKYLYIEKAMKNGAKIGLIIELGDEGLIVDIYDWVADRIVATEEVSYAEFATPDEEYYGPAT